jgi:hypothetical protein
MNLEKLAENETKYPSKFAFSLVTTKFSFSSCDLYVFICEPCVSANASLSQMFFFATKHSKKINFALVIQVNTAGVSELLEYLTFSV